MPSGSVAMLILQALQVFSPNSSSRGLNSQYWVGVYQVNSMPKCRALVVMRVRMGSNVDSSSANVLATSGALPE